jgi:hypothetical protein
MRKPTNKSKTLNFFVGDMVTYISDGFVEGKFIVIENNHPTYVIKGDSGSMYMVHHSSIERLDVIRNNKITDILND